MRIYSSKFGELTQPITFIQSSEIFPDGIVVFAKHIYSVDEIDLMESLGVNHETDQIYHIRTSEISNYSLFKLMSFAFKDFMYNEEFEEARQALFAKLQVSYKTLKSNFAELARIKFERFDDLMHHQQECVYYGATRRDNIFALEQGMGKTATAIAISKILDPKVTLIITPAVVKWNWPQEMMYWDISMGEISVIDSQDNYIAPYERYILINFDLLSRHYDKLCQKEIGLIVVDECHKIKNTDSLRTDIVQKLQNELKARLCLLSGTPATNGIEDIYSYLRLTNHKYSNKLAFYRRFTEEVFVGGVKKIKGKDIWFLNMVISNLLIRKTKKILNLPPKNYHRLIFDLGNYKSEYDAFYNELVEKVRLKKSNREIDLSIQRLSIITAKSKIKEIISMAETMSSQMETVLVDEKFIERDKVTILTNKEIKVPGKVVIFCMNTEPIEMLASHFKDRCVVVDGKVAPKKRVELAKKFLRSRTVNFFIGQLDASGIGINLINKAHDKEYPPVYRVIHVNYPFTAAQLEQGNDRVHRVGQYHDVDIYCTVARDTIDEKILSIIERKQRDISMLIEGQTQEIDFNEVYLDELEILKQEIEKEQQFEAIQEQKLNGETWL